MKHDVVLAGVGGQGILTIAKGLSLAAIEKGLSVKQAEVHGMSQRGGAVYANVRISDKELFSDLIAVGQADMVLAVEPLEALRYVEYLRSDGVVIANVNAVTNIQGYPAIEEVLDEISKLPQHVMVDMEKLGRAAGSPLAANMVGLGAASLFLSFEPGELEAAIRQMFEHRGDRVIEVNERAFRFGRTAAAAYLEGLQRGYSSRSIRQWIDTLDAEHLAADDAFENVHELDKEEEGRLTGAEAHAFESILLDAYYDGRKQLFEHEVYRLIELIGAISPPRHTFVPKGAMISKEVLAQYPGERVVIKLVSPEVVHKSDAQAVIFAPNDYESVRKEIDKLIERHAGTSVVAGTLVVEFVEQEHRGFGSELFVGVRSTREFGPVIAAGLGGLQTEYLASKMRPGVAVAKAVVSDITAEEFLELFKKTATYELLSGQVRGSQRIVSDGELLRCFRAFISLARRFCVDRAEEGPDIGELEVNPFAFRQQRLVPLDGRGTLRTATQARPIRPYEKVDKLLEPASIAVVGVSVTSMNFGRIILNSIVNSGFDRSKLYVIRDDVKEVDGVACVKSISELPKKVDLLVIASPGSSVPGLIDEANEGGKVSSGIIISGGVGESEGSEDLSIQVHDAIQRGRAREDGGAVFIGPNCMGVQSRPGKYDTFFIPEHKLDPRRHEQKTPLAIISQSGAFVISRLSSLGMLEPAFAISIGNQIDVTVSDLMWAVSRRDDVRAVGVYLEGFADLDGIEFLRAAQALKDQGKTLVFYKAGRTETGRSAAAGHTAAVAGDYDVCHAAAELTGAIVTEDFKEFEGLLMLSALLSEKQFKGRRLFAVTNAGMEAVGLADALGNSLELLPPGAALQDALRITLEAHRLDRLVSPRNPLDVTPMACEAAYADLCGTLLASPEVDGLIVSAVPLTPQMKTTADEIDDPCSIAHLLPHWAAESTKPIVFVADAGRTYDALADEVLWGGVPVFRTIDSAARALSRYWNARA